MSESSTGQTAEKTALHVWLSSSVNPFADDPRSDAAIEQLSSDLAESVWAPHLVSIGSHIMKSGSDGDANLKARKTALYSIIRHVESRRRRWLELRASEEYTYASLPQPPEAGLSHDCLYGDQGHGAAGATYKLANDTGIAFKDLMTDLNPSHGTLYDLRFPHWYQRAFSSTEHRGPDAIRFQAENLIRHCTARKYYDKKQTKVLSDFYELLADARASRHS